jgi:hypothetical protein
MNITSETCSVNYNHEKEQCQRGIIWIMTLTFDSLTETKNRHLPLIIKCKEKSEKLEVERRTDGLTDIWQSAYLKSILTLSVGD